MFAHLRNIPIHQLFYLTVSTIQNNPTGSCWYTNLQHSRKISGLGKGNGNDELYAGNESEKLFVGILYNKLSRPR